MKYFGASYKHPNSRKVLGSGVPSKSGRVRVAILRSGVIHLVRYVTVLQHDCIVELLFRVVRGDPDQIIRRSVRFVEVHWHSCSQHTSFTFAT